MSDPQDPSPPRIRNITDLARLAGVSAGTVSRALAGKSVVNHETRERIQALATEHGFQLNQMARRLRAQRTGVIGVVVPLGHEKRQHLSDPFFMTMLGHLADDLTERGYDLMLSRIIPDADNWLEAIVSSGMLDGVLLIGQSDQFEAIERVARSYRPLVVWGTSLPGQVHCAVGVDNRLGGRIAAERLIARGAKRLAFLGEIRTLELSERFKGVCDAVTAAGLEAPLQLDTHLASDIMAGEIAAHVDATGNRIDAIVAASDVIAMNTVRVLADKGISVPDAIAITGFDDLPFADQTVPRLTTIRQDLKAGARAMTDALFARLGGEDAPSVQMVPSLVLRDTA
jgi:DNA-binding LacI/PurR family transcriptional regulator